MTRPRPYPAPPERVFLSRQDWLGIVACLAGVAASLVSGGWMVASALMTLEKRMTTMEQIELDGQRRDNQQDDRLNSHDAALMRIGRATP